MKKIFFIITLIIIAVLVFLISQLDNFEEQDFINNQQNQPVSNNINIENFQDCVSAGNPVMESYPRKCRSGDKTFTEYIGNELEKADLIRLDSPRPNVEVSSPLTVQGQARGTWFFEGDFPIILTDWDGRIIAESYATAKTDWMTENFVEFIAELEFETPELYNRGSLILQKDNPSGLPENDDALEIPIFFK